MKRIDLDETRLTVAELAKLAKNGPVILTQHGKPLAAIKHLPGSDWESISLANDPRFVGLIEEARRSYRETGGVPLAEVRQELGLTAKPARRMKPKRNQSRASK